MAPFPNTETIEAWLAGELPKTEAQQMQHREQTEPAFAELVARHRLAHEAIEINLGALLKERLQALNPIQETPTTESESAPFLASPTEGTTRPFWRQAATWGIAASIVLLIAISLSMFYQHTDQSIAKQFAEAYAAPPVRGELGPEELVNQGLAAYQDERHQEAIAAFSQLPQDHPRYIEMRFYLGNSALKLGQSKQAIQAFQLVLNEKDVRFAPAAEWYLALAYLQDGQLQKAKRTASRLSKDPESAYQEQANHLLDKLGSSWRW